MKRWVLAGLLPAMFSPAVAQIAAPQQPSSELARAPENVASDAGIAMRRIPPKTIVMIAIDSDLSSKTNQTGENFPIYLAEPIVVDGKTMIPAGTVGRGEIVHAARAGFGGKAGEMILAARYLQCGAMQVPLGRFKFSAIGESKVGEAMAVGMVVPLAAFAVGGSQVIIPKGARATAETKTEIILPAEPAPPCQADAGAGANSTAG